MNTSQMGVTLSIDIELATSSKTSRHDYSIEKIGGLILNDKEVR
jgi:hypothetical protein